MSWDFMLPFAHIMFVFYSPWQESVKNMLPINKDVNERDLSASHEQFINHQYAWTAVTEWFATLQRRLEVRQTETR